MEDDKLKEFIESNREGLDMSEPSSSLWGAIEQELEPDQNTGSIPWHHLAIAASMAVLIGISFFLGRKVATLESTVAHDVSEQQESEAMNQVSEIEHYYAVQVNTLSEELERYEVDDEFLDALKELKNEFAALDEELSVGANPELIVQAMIENYRLQLELLEDLLDAVKNEPKIPQQDEKRIT